MQGFKHTPGPWEKRSGGSETTGVYSGAVYFNEITPRQIAEIIHHGEGQFDNVLPTDEDLANANLVSAAPDLLTYAMLEERILKQHEYGRDETVDILEKHGWNKKETLVDFMARIRRAAILKATGGA